MWKSSSLGSVMLVGGSLKLEKYYDDYTALWRLIILFKFSFLILQRDNIVINNILFV